MKKRGSKKIESRHYASPEGKYVFDVVISAVAAVLILLYISFCVVLRTMRIQRKKCRSIEQLTVTKLL